MFQNLKLLVITFASLTSSQSISSESKSDFINATLDFFNYELKLTNVEKTKLSTFRSRVISTLPKEYMKEDIFLIRFLRAKHLNIPSAQQMLERHLKWRNDNKIDNILKEDWKDFEREYKVSLEGCDKSGHPVIYINIGHWEIRKAVVTGNVARLKRYYEKIYEEASTMIRAARAEGQNVTQTYEIYDFQNFNLAIHACPRCLEIIAYFYNTFENNFPGTTYRNMFINVPSIFQTLWQLFLPLQSEDTRRANRIFRKDKSKWMAALDQDIDKSQLTKGLGGLKDEPVNLQELRTSGRTFAC